MSFMFTETVQVITAGTKTDRYGNTEPDWSTASERDEACLVGKGGSVEPLLDARTPVDTVMTLVFQHRDPGITPADRVRVRGVVYEVDGHPFVQMWGSRPGIAGTSVDLKVREG